MFLFLFLERDRERELEGEGGGLAYPTGGDVWAALEHDEGVLAVRGPSAPGCPCLPHPQGS